MPEAASAVLFLNTFENLWLNFLSLYSPHPHIMCPVPQRFAEQNIYAMRLQPEIAMPEVGQTIVRYGIVEKIGQGGMGEVYLADDTTLDRKVALKFLPEAFTSDPERMARFEREAKLLAALNHFNIAGIYGLEQTAGNRFLVLEYVEGETLQARLSKGALSLEDALALCLQISEGLEAAHEFVKCLPAASRRT
jgi:serine/threonine protein kinase